MSSDQEKTPEQQQLDKLKTILDTIQTQIALENAKKTLETAQKGTSPELAQLQKTSDLLTAQKSIAENQKAIAEAQAGTVAAQFPKGSVTPLEGEIKTDEKFGYTARLVSIQAMKSQAAIIADKISLLPDKTKQLQLVKPTNTEQEEDNSNMPVLQGIEKPTKILIVNDLEYAAGDGPLWYVESSIDSLKSSAKTQKMTNQVLIESLGKLEKPLLPSRAKRFGAEISDLVGGVATPGLTAVSRIVSSVAEIIGYIQVDYTIKGQEFTLDNQALVAAVAGNIRNTLPVVVENFYFSPDSEIINQYVSLIGSKQELDSVTEQLKSKIKGFDDDKNRIQELQKQLKDPNNKDNAKLKAELDTLNNKPNPPPSWTQNANAAVTNSDALSKAIAAFADAVTKATDEKTSILIKAALRKRVINLDISHLLYLKIVSSGGEAMTLKSRFRSGKTAFVGGCAITYVLATVNGAIVNADTLPVLSQLNYDLSLNGQRVYKPVPLDGTGAKTRLQHFIDWWTKG